ncbi:MAG TPA: HAD hydrolase-like protein [Thermoanaerobaculia bacterium]|nr:HAD hydrolase-like protein [Thermoanaerobaculia bacterium]
MLRVGPDEVVMVGDSLEHDVIAPRRAGIFSVWFNENNRHDAAAMEVPTISRLSDLVPLLHEPPR